MERVQGEEHRPWVQKFFYHGENSKRNGVGIVLREDVLEISRINDRIIEGKFLVLI